jgi:translation initiation factor 5A
VIGFKGDNLGINYYHLIFHIREVNKMEDYEFESGNAGSAGIEKVAAGSLKKGDLVMIKGHPCKVVSFSTAKTGKHGSAKAMVTGIDIFTSGKYECTFSTSDSVDAPLVDRKEYSLINIDDENFCTLLTESGETKEDLKTPEDEWLKDVKEKILEIFNAGTNECLVTVIGALGNEKIIAVREGKEQ